MSPSICLLERTVSVRLVAILGRIVAIEIREILLDHVWRVDRRDPASNSAAQLEEAR